MDTSPKHTQPHPASSFGDRPATATGRWSGWLALASILSLVVAGIGTGLLEDPNGSTAESTFRLVMFLVLAASGIGALALCLRSLVALGERSFVVWASTVAGAAVTLLVIAELTFLE